MSGAQRLSQFPGLLMMEQFGRTDPSRVHGLRWGRRAGSDSITRKEGDAHPLREVEVKILIRSPVENTKYLWVTMMSLTTQPHKHRLCMRELTPRLGLYITAGSRTTTDAVGQ